MFFILDLELTTKEANLLSEKIQLAFEFTREKTFTRIIISGKKIK